MRKVLSETVRLCKDPLYLVGGPVRDLLLRKNILDMDFAVEGDAAGLSRQLAETLGGKTVVHARFHTAKIIFPTGVVADIAQTRRERYPDAAKLPVVEPGAPIADDLARRDFSIQAMALRLNGPDAGRIIDPFNGQEDLKDRAIRILHPDSFRDDPVRAFRAIRYATRYAFHLEKNTALALRALLRNPDLLRTASDRIMDEWRRTFQEPRWPEILRMLCKYELLAWLGIRSAPEIKSLKKSDGSFRNLCRMFEDPPEEWTVRWISFLSYHPRTVRLRIADRLPFPRPVRKIFSETVEVGKIVNLLNGRVIKPSRAVELLSNLPPAWLAALDARCDRRGQARIRQFLLKWRQIPPPATGDDLRRWGIAPGPVYPRILKKLYAARLDGRLRTDEDIKRIVSAYQVMK